MTRTLKLSTLKLSTLKTLCLGLLLGMTGSAAAQAQTVVAQSSFPGAAGADLSGTAAATGGTWTKDMAFPNSLLLDGNGGVYPGGGNVFGTYKLPVSTSGTVTLEADVYVAGTLASANGNGLSLDAYDSSGQEHGYKGSLYYETTAANAHWEQVRVDSASATPGIGTNTTPVLTAGSYYHIQYSLAPGAETLRVGPAQTGLTAYPYTGAYTTVSSAADSTYTVNGPVGVGTYSYLAATATGGLHLLNFQATVPASARAAATSFYVDPVGGSDSNDGLSGTAAGGHGPWLSASKAASFSYVSGDQLFIKGGTTLSGSLAFSGQPPTLVTSYGTGNATISAPAGADGLSVVGFGGCTVSSLVFTGPETPATITNTGVWTHGIRFNLPGGQPGSVSGVSVQNCIVTGFDVGMSIWAKGNNAAYLGTSVTGNTVHDCPGNGIIVRGVEGTGGTPGTSSIAYNTVYNIPGVHFASNDQGVDGDTSGCGIIATDQRYSTIEHNLLHDSGSGNNLTAGPGATVCVNYNYSRIRDNEAYGWRTGNADGCAFDLDGGCQYSEIAYNYSHNNGGAGLFLCNFTGFTNTGNTIHHNISIDDAIQHNGSVQFDGTDTSFAVYNNTIVQNRSTAPLIFSGNVGITGLFANNLFVYKSNAILLNLQSAFTVGPSQIRFLGNDYYSPDGSPFNAVISGQATQTTLQGFRTAYGYETLSGADTSRVASPGWVSTAYDAPPTVMGPGVTSPSSLRLYDLTPTSATVGAGVPYSLLGIAYSGLGAAAPTDDFHSAPLQPVADVGAVTLPAGGYPAAPAAPVALALTITHNASNQPILTWVADPLATLYLEERSTDGVSYTVFRTDPPGTLTDTDTARPNVATVYYHVISRH